MTNRNKIHTLCDRLQEIQKKRLYASWEKTARPNQKIPPGNWRVWLILAGRGFGKTRTGAETIHKWAKEGVYRHIALVSESFLEGQRIMVQGPSGLLSLQCAGKQPSFCASKKQLIWSNGATATLFSAKAYHQLRGPQFDAVWVDEFAKLPYLEEVWHQLNFCLRLGDCPRMILTTTPRPLPLLKTLVSQEDVHVTWGHTFENAKNLSKSYIDEMKKRYAHTFLGQQELEGKILQNTSSGLWSETMIEKSLWRHQTIPLLKRVVVAIDPAATANATSDETGIVVAGVDEHNKGYVLKDLSGKYPPYLWAQKAIEAYHAFKADRIVAEVNNGGDLVERMLRVVDASVSYKGVRASRGKFARAEPVAALYERDQVFHVAFFPQLCQQLLNCGVDISKKPSDRLDALVWALTDLMIVHSALPLPSMVPRAWAV